MLWGGNLGLLGLGVLQKVEKNEFSSIKLQNIDQNFTDKVKNMLLKL